MAVIGARPATGPWFLGGGIRPRTRRRARRIGGRHHGVSLRRTRSRVDIRGLLVAIVVAASLALFYLSQSTHVAATGYEIDALQARLAQARAEQQQLVYAIGHARSPAEITRRARAELELIPLEDGAVTFAPPVSTDAD